MHIGSGTGYRRHKRRHRRIVHNHDEAYDRILPNTQYDHALFQKSTRENTEQRSCEKCQMFHIFRWRREHNQNDDKSTPNSLVSRKYKRQHLRQNRERILRETRYRQGLLHNKQHWSTDDLDKYQ
ncbi:unnamed protein product [Adineta steineri]|nr:unnamed protein product [Adineta steineri]